MRLPRIHPGRRAVIAGLGACLATGLLPRRPSRAQDTDESGDPATRLYETSFRSLDLSPVAQVRLGQDLERRLIDRAGGIYLNPSVQAAIVDFARPIFDLATDRSLNWEVTVVDNSIPAAWVLPGGHIVVYKGLLRYLDAPDELAAVIAHEMGHAERNHLQDIMRQRSFTDSIPSDQIPALAAAVQNDPVRGILSPPALAILEKAIFDAIRAGYGPEREAAADQTIVRIFAGTGHDPALAARAFETIAAPVPKGATGTTCLYSGREPTKARAATLRRYARVATDEPPANSGFDIIKSVFPTRHYVGFPDSPESTS